MPELSDFVVELVSLGIDAIVCIGVYHGFKHVKKTLQDVKVRLIRSAACKILTIVIRHFFL